MSEQLHIHVYRRPGARWPDACRWVWAVTEGPELPMTKLLDGRVAPDIFEGVKYGFASTRRMAMREARHECIRRDRQNEIAVETMRWSGAET